MVASYRASLELKIDGEIVPETLMEDVLQVVVEESLHQPNLFVLVLRNSYKPGSEGDRQWQHQNLIKIGKSITIGFGSSTTMAADYQQPKEVDNLFEGEITAIETHFTEQTQAPIIIRGYDSSHRLHRGLYSRSFQNMTDSEIVQRIAQEVGIPIQTDDSQIPHDYVFQANQSNMAFLRDRANRLGFELFMRNGKLHFRKPKSGQDITLKWLVDLHSFHVRLSTAEQIQQVEVRAWDYGAKRPIVSTARSEQLITETETTRSQPGSNANSAFKQLPQPQLVIVDRPVFHSKEADLIAQARCNEQGGQYIHADAKAEGNPEIRPGCQVELEDLGPYSGKYYITETRHLLAERVYTTDFTVRGSRTDNLLETLTPKNQLQPGQTFLVGIVTDNEDPEGWGRVKVKFPTLTEDHASNWARTVSIGAGSDRGCDCLPEIDDEVLVGFEHGDIHRPYVLGNVWNGQDAPPNAPDKNVQDGKVRLRTFRTRTGHQIQFVEESGITEENGTGVYIKTAGGHQVYLDDSDGSISIHATTDLKLNAVGNIDITAGGVVTVKGSLIKLN